MNKLAYISKYNQNFLKIKEIDQYSKTHLPSLQVTLYHQALLSPTNHLFIKGRYIPTGIKTVFDDKKLSGLRQMRLYIKSRFLLNNNKYKGTYLWAHDAYSGNYYHWLYEALPRFILMKKEYPDAIVIMPEFFKNIGFVNDSLQMINFNCIWIDQTQTNVFENLVTAITNPPVGNVLDVRIIKLMQRVLFKNIANLQATEYKKIYLSRAKARYRKLINENELLFYIKEAGYTVINAEDLSFAEQAAIFFSADSFISLHGAGLSNMLFMQAGSKVLEIRNQSWNAQPLCYLGVANVLDIKWNFILAEPNLQESLTEDIAVNEELFRSKLAEFENL